MRRGEIWFAAVPGGDRPVMVLTRDPVADRIGAVVDTLHTIARDRFRRRVAQVSAARMTEACRCLLAATGC